MSRRPSIKRLRCLFDYDPRTGELTWKERSSPKSRIKIGSSVGSPTGSGYLETKIDGYRLLVHVAIFAMVKGRWPKKEVDHRDTIRANNRWRNLRTATSSQNKANSKIRKDSGVGLKGVQRREFGFQAQIQAKGRRYCLGTYPTAEAAHAAYVTKAKELFGEFARAK